MSMIDNTSFKAPHEYSRRILLAVTGLSPQIVTETLYALAVQPTDHAFIPTEIHIITTKEGKERACLSLLSEEPGWFYRLCQDYNLPQIHFNESTIHVLQDPIEGDLSDIRSLQDNETAADLITDKVREFTQDKAAAMHVSIAGGRKTMGFYVGYALSLFGRQQDRLSHVLVQPNYESLWDFYYPTLYSRIIYTRPPENKPLDTQHATVTLANIPFVRLRHGLPKTLLEGKTRFSTAVNAVQKGIAQAQIRIDIAKKTVWCGDQAVKLPPVQFAFYLWFATRKKEKEPPLCWDYEQTRQDFAEQYLIYYAYIFSEGEHAEKYKSRVSSFKSEKGMKHNGFFSQTRTKTNGKITQVIGKTLAQKYHIKSREYSDTQRNKVYEIDLSPDYIEIIKLSYKKIGATSKMINKVSQPRCLK